MRNLWVKLTTAMIAFIIIGASMIQPVPASASDEAEAFNKPTTPTTPVEKVKNYAPLATVEIGFPSLTPIGMLHDGNDESVWSSTVTPEFPNDITLDLGQTRIKTNKISLMTWFAQGQGITDLDVEYWDEDQWKPAVQHVELAWETNDVTKEVKEIGFPEVVTNKIRLKVNAANTVWGNIAINELQWWGVEPPPTIVNVAPEGTFTVSGVADSAGTERLNDQNEQNGWTGVPTGRAPVYLTLDMGGKRARTGKLSLVSSNFRKQGVKDIDIEYYNGERWVTLEQHVLLSWSRAASGNDIAEVEFDPVAAHRLRIKVNDSWAGGRSFVMHEIKVWGYAFQPPAPQSNDNIAIAAAVTADFTGLPGQSLSALNDGNVATSWTSKPKQAFPGAFTLTFDREITTNKINLASSKGASYGISNVTIQYLRGQTWDTAAENVSVSWNSDTADVEQGEVRFQAVQTSAIRIQVNAVRSVQGQFTLSEIRIWDTNRAMPPEPALPPLPVPAMPPEPEHNPDINIAVAAAADTTFPLKPGYAIGLINDGSMESAWSSETGVEFPGSITLDWGNQMVKTNRITLYTWFAQGQGITNVDVEYDKDGEWVTAVSGQAIAWKTNDTTFEPADIVFPAVETSKIRLKVNEANVVWGNFCINELKVWQAR